MSSSDSSDRTGSRRDQRSSPSNQPAPDASGVQPDARGRDALGTGGSSRRRGRSGNSDFGSFVSSAVRTSADRFKTPDSRRAPSRATPSAPQGPAGATVPGPERTETAETRTPEPRRDRPRRYWRDSLAGSSGVGEGARGSSEDSEPASTGGSRGIRVTRRGQGDDGGDGGGRIRFERRNQGDGDGGGFIPGVNLPTRTLLGIIGGALLLLLSLVFILNQAGDDTNDDGDVTPTSTVESVLNPVDGLERTDADTPSTPGSGDATQPGGNRDANGSDATEPTSEETSGSTEEDEEPRRGGDNQLDPSNDATETPES